jgi:hypothetical protein
LTALSKDGKKVYFTAAVDGTTTFEVNFPGMTKKSQRVQQVTKGDFDVNDLVLHQQQHYRKQRRYEPCFRNFDLKKKILGNKSPM